MRTRVKTLLFILFFASTSGLYAQFLSAEDAVAIALKNNFSIQLSKLNERILQNNVTLGNAGFLPQADASVVRNSSITNTRQEFLSGETTDRNNAKSSTLNAGVGLDWTLFDGLQMFTGYEILKKQLEAGKIETRIEIENVVANVLQQYYNIVQLKQKVRMFEQSVALGKARVEIADNKLLIGAGSRLDLLQARVDMNSDISQLLNLNDLITEATVGLNLMLARDPATDFAVEDTIILLPPADYNILRSNMQKENARLQLSMSETQLALLNLRNIKGRRYPEFAVNMGYNFNRQDSESGFIRTGRSEGLTYGFAARLPLFNGFNQSRLQKNASIQIDAANLQYDSFVAEIDAQLLSTYAVYNNKLKNLELERENLQTAYTNFDIANERYRLGELAGIEIREAQQNLLIARDRLITLIYQARLLEIELMQLTGGILPDVQ